MVSSISQLAGCKPINEAYYAVKTAWCCKVTASLWWMVFGYTLIGEGYATPRHATPLGRAAPHGTARSSIPPHTRSPAGDA